MVVSKSKTRILLRESNVAGLELGGSLACGMNTARVSPEAMRQSPIMPEAFHVTVMLPPFGVTGRPVTDVSR